MYMKRNVRQTLFILFGLLLFAGISTMDTAQIAYAAPLTGTYDIPENGKFQLTNDLLAIVHSHLPNETNLETIRILSDTFDKTYPPLELYSFYAIANRFVIHYLDQGGKSLDSSNTAFDNVGRVYLSSSYIGIHRSHEGKEYFVVNGVEYGPFDSISSDGNVTVSPHGWGFQYYNGSKRGCMVNGQDVNPQYGCKKLAFSSNQWGIVYDKLGSQDYIKVNGQEQGPFDPIQANSFSLGNNGFSFLTGYSGASQTVFVNTQTIGTFQSPVSYLTTMGNVTFFVYQREGKDYIRVNDKEYGPYDSYTVRPKTDGNIWGFSYVLGSNVYVNIGDTVYGPYQQLQQLGTIDVLSIKEGGWGFLYKQNDQWFLNISGRVIPNIPPVVNEVLLAGQNYMYSYNDSQGTTVQVNDKRFGPYKNTAHPNSAFGLQASKDYYGFIFIEDSQRRISVGSFQDTRGTIGNNNNENSHANVNSANTTPSPDNETAFPLHTVSFICSASEVSACQNATLVLNGQSVQQKDPITGYPYISVPQGTYTLLVSSPGYIPFQETFIVNGPTEKVFTLIPISSTANNGNINNSSPQYKIGFLCSSPQEAACQKATIIFNGQQITLQDPDGYYYAVIPQGTYKLSVSSPGYISLEETVTVQGVMNKSFSLLPAPFFDGIQHFTDISLNDPLYNATAYLKKHGWIQGYPNGAYGGQNLLNRAEFARIITNGMTNTPQGSHCFNDVAEEWFANAVCHLKQNGIIRGYPGNIFLPAKNINLAEVLKMTLLARNIPLLPNSGTYWYNTYLSTALKYSYLDGINPDPAHFVTRAEMALLLYNISLNSDSLE